MCGIVGFVESHQAIPILLEVMSSGYPDEIYVVRKDSPMIIGLDDGESYIASDVPAILNHCKNVYYIGNLKMARATAGAVTSFNIDGDEIRKELTEITFSAEAAEKGDFEHFMMKEIHEQPKVIADTFGKYVHDGKIDLSEVGLTDDDIKGFFTIYIVACGSAWHAGVVTQYVCEEFTDLPVRVELVEDLNGLILQKAYW